MRIAAIALFEPETDLAGLAEMTLAFGPRTFFEAGGVAGDVVWCDVTGCAHLHAGASVAPEHALALRLEERVRAMGHACRVAISDGPRIAAAAARFAPASKPGPLVIPAGKGAAALHRLPLASLPLGEEAVRWLTKLGVRTAGDLARLPRRSLGTRLGKEGPRVMALLLGDDRDCLAPHVPPEVPEERAELEYGIAMGEALVFVVKRLADRLSSRLAGRSQKTQRLELCFRLDRALLPDRGGTDEHAHKVSLEIAPPAPLGRADELLAVLRARLESWEAPAPVLEVTLRAKELVTSEGQPLDLLVPEARAERALPRLGAELAAELGEGSVGTLALCDSWIPEERAWLVSLSFPPKPSSPRPRCGGVADVPSRRANPRAHHSLLSGAPEPSRVLRVGLPYREVSPLRLLERIETIAWWREGVSRSFFVSWTSEAQAMAWVEVDSKVGEPWLRGWMD